MIEYLSKICLILMLSALIGSEREYNDKPCGLRTIMLVGFSSTLFTIIGLEFLGSQEVDGLRLLYATIMGIGFLGGGVVMKTGKSVEGITTASTLWATVAIGLLCGIGKFVLASISAIIIVGILFSKYIRIKLALKLSKNREK